MLRHFVLRDVIPLILIQALTAAWATCSFANSCNVAAQIASEKTGVPLPILKALTLAETGRELPGATYEPWPWAVHSQNRGHWFATEAKALTFVKDLQASGEKNIDIGCFQLNVYWHREQFLSVEQMINPETNAIYAAEFLVKLFSETGTWRAAAGAYHSRDTSKSDPYLARLERLYATYLASAASEPVVSRKSPPRAGFSLRGSVAPLVERTASALPLIGARQ